MSHQSDTQRGVRAQRRATHRVARRRERLRAHLRTGQTLVIFVLSFTVLLGLAGLTIDVTRAYDLYGRMQRAAEAGALAGALYMPLNYSTNYSDGNNAVTRALQETVKDGFGISVLIGLPASISSTYFGCPNPPASFEVAVCPSPTATNDLQVYVTQTLNLVLLNGLGVAPITLRASAQADYAPPIQLSGRYNFIGDQIECSPGNSENTNSGYCATTDTSNNTNRLNYYFAAMSGPAQLQETGDPYVYCSEGPTQLTSGGNLTTDPNLGSDTVTTYNSQTTNHPQQTGVVPGSTISQYCGKPSPGGNPGNPDYQPDSYAGEATKNSTLHAGGYNYLLNIQPNTGPTNLWVYNPYFIPGVANGPDQFEDNGSPSSYRGPLDDGITSFDTGAGCATPPCGHYDAPYFYFNTTVSIYHIFNLYDRTSDVLVASQTFQPYDAMPQDLAVHGCPSGTVFDPTSASANTANWYHNRAGIVANGSGCVTPSASNGLACAPVSAATMSQWCKVSGPSLADTTKYRVVVEVQGITSGAATNALDPRGYDYNSTQVSGFGQHDYGMKACLSTATGAYGNQGCGIGAKGVGQFGQPFITFYGWNNFGVAYRQALSTATPNANYPQTACVTSNTTPYACADLACIPTEFAGRTISMRIYDPGDAPSGDMYLGIVPPNPATATVSYSAYGAAIQTTTLDGDLVVHTRYSSSYNGYRPFNGLWLNAKVQFSSSYVGDCALTTKPKGVPGFWQLAYISSTSSSGGNPNDSMTASLTLVGSPVHLVPVG